MRTLHASTFQYLTPTIMQTEKMKKARDAVAAYAEQLEQLIPDGADKVYLMRKLREVAMWANVAITRNTDGEPRAD